MKTRPLVMAMLLMPWFAGCTPDAPPAPANEATPVEAPVPAAPLATPVPPANFEGHGELRFGIDEAAFRAGFRGELAGGGEGCFHLSPAAAATPAELAFMFEQGRFVRYSTAAPTELAPGGGRVGMHADEIRQLYAGRIEERPHKYVPGGYYLRIADAGASALVFEVDAEGRISEWRVGRAPQVDYVEGCS